MSEERTIIAFDYAIKTVLREKANFTILEGFLSELLEKEVKVIDLLESESNKEYATFKTNRVDLKARIDGGEIVIFEIQVFTQVDFFGKLLFDVSKAVVEQVSIGEKYDIKKIYMIGIAYFNLQAKQDYLFRAKLSGFEGAIHKEIIPFSQTYGLILGETVSDIHPEYFLILPNMFGEKIRSKFDEWIYTLKNSVIKTDFSAAGLQEAVVKLDMLKMPDKDRRVYEKYLRNKKDDDTCIETSRKEGKEEGIEIGKEQGIEIGKEQGIEIGKEQGIEIGKEQGIEIGKEQGIEIGKEQGKTEGKVAERQNILELIEKGYSVEEIRKLLSE